MKRAPIILYVLYENGLFIGASEELKGLEELRDKRAGHAERTGKKWKHEIAAYRKIEVRSHG